ncbi:hypothetical protein ACO2Q0_02045 [Phenylobacterium sp. VNQ135]|uniref:hypothetical protein n=1 Tax=Phenylobacterium sp. VNQ135 TaxID=3400922 RepID=UPI003C03C1C2
MAVRPYSDLDSTRYDTGYERRHEVVETTSGGVGGKIFLWVAWALAAAFWAFTLTAGVGILNSMGSANGPGPGEVDAGGVGWGLMNVVGVVVLGLALAYGAYRYFSRDKRTDALTEAATRAEYDMVEAAGGDDDISRSPDARRPLDRDAARAAGAYEDPTTGGLRP